MTTDGGAHWSAQQSGTRLTLISVSFADASHGWAVGGGPAYPDPAEATLILATTDGGKHWTSQFDEPGQPLYAVACADPQHAWASGGYKNPSILATSDGGRTWTNQLSDRAVGPIVDLSFADSVHGWAVSALGQVLSTTDGGVTWNRQAKLRGREFDFAIAFADAGHGWVVSDGNTTLPGSQSLGHVWTTSDGGATWERTPPPEGFVADIPDVTCTDSQHVWACTNAGIFRSTDAGASWTGPARNDIATPIPSVATSTENPLRAAFANAVQGWAVFQESDRGVIAVTTDGGISWAEQVSPNKDQLWGVACPPPAR